MAIFDRLIGVETEYAVRREHGPRGQSVRSVFFGLVDQLPKRLPIAKADFLKCCKMGVFLANGGAVWLEQPLPGASHGLIEGATPECRSPRDVLTWQRAQDRLLGATVAEARQNCRLLKNSRDPYGESYGTQDNYEIDFASGWRLMLWRLGVIIGLPLHLFAVMAMSFLVVFALVIGIPLEILRRCFRFVTRQPNDSLHHYWNPIEAQFCVYPPWMERAVVRLLPFTAILSETYLILLLRVTKLPRVIRLMTPFLVSRGIFAGAGGLDQRGRFRLGEKAMSRSVIWQDFLADRIHAVVSIGNFTKRALVMFQDPRHFPSLIARRQRLQVGLGDSNMCETSEYLRVATTALILDAIEAGAIQRVPALQSPSQALHTFNADDTLTLSHPLRAGGEMTAIEIQRHYWTLCDRFVRQTPDAPPEARAVLRKWRRVLDDLEADPDRLIGQIDWVTKRWLLNTAGQGLSTDQQRAMSIRYHELSPSGHYFRLEQAGVTAKLVSRQELDRALRTGPPNTRAADRARRIREFSGDGKHLVMSWDAVPQTLNR